MDMRSSNIISQNFLLKKFFFLQLRKKLSPMRTILGHQIGKYNIKSISGCKHAAHISKCQQFMYAADTLFLTFRGGRGVDGSPMFYKDL